MSTRTGAGSVPQARGDRDARKLRRGPPITLTCECGATRELQYGERWRCEDCGRVWDTTRIPRDQYADIRRIQMRLRWMMLALFGVALVCIAGFIAIGKAFGGIFIVALAMMGWRLYLWPRYRRRYLDAISELPEWNIRAE